MTAIAEDLDLSWVTFTDDREDECCELDQDGVECSREAVAVAVFDRLCGCGPSLLRCCADHRDELLAEDREPDSDWRCSECGAPMRLLRIDSIR